MRRFALSGLAFSILTTTSFGAPTCPNGWPIPDEWDEMPIPVFLNTQIDEDICPNSSCSSFNDIRRSLEAALDEYHHISGGDIWFRYAGETREAPQAIIDGAIHVFSNNCTGSDLAVAAPGADGGAFGGKIRICIGNDSGPINWQSFDPSGGPSFHAVMLHEVGHLLGMDHIEQCTSSFAQRSIMHEIANDVVSQHLQRTDLEFVHTAWGTRTTIGRPKWTTDALDWNDGGGLPPILHSERVLGRFASSNTATSGNNLFVAWSDWTMAVLWLSRYTPTSWTIQSGFFESVSYHPGIASSGDEVLLAWLANREPMTGLQDVMIRVSANQGITLGPETVISNSSTRTANAGVTATFDSESGQYVVIWRGSGSNRNEILYKVVGSASGPWKLVLPGTGPVGFSSGLKASDTPSMACGPSSLVGEFNCLIAWSDAMNWQDQCGGPRPK